MADEATHAARTFKVREQDEVTKIFVRRLTHREGFVILVIPPNGGQPDHFEFWVDEHYIPATQRPTRRKKLLAEVLKMAAILRSAYNVGAG